MQVRVRVELPDTPGALAGLALACGESYVNILSVRAYPAVDTVIDDLVLDVPSYWSVQDLQELIVAAGGCVVSVLEASRGDLEDDVAQWLQGALAVLEDPSCVEDVVAQLMGPISTPVHAEARRADLLRLVQRVATGEAVPADVRGVPFLPAPRSTPERSLISRGAAAAGHAARASLRLHPS